MGRRETVCELPTQVRHLPATKRTFPKFVNQKAAAFWDVFVCMTMETADYTEYELTLELNRSCSVVLRLLCVFFFF
jgi:hypothetical protein